MIGTSISRKFLSVCCISFAGLALWAARSELEQYSFPTTAGDRFDRLEAAQALIAGLSSDSHRASLDECWWGLTDAYGVLQTPSRLQNAATNCLTATSSLLRTYPSLSYGWLVVAIANEQLGQFGAMSDALQRSREAAPSEARLAQLRVSLVERNLARLSEQAISDETSDLKLLLQSYSGTASIIVRYREDRAFRARISDILPGLAMADQQRFVQDLENTMGSP